MSDRQQMNLKLPEGLREKIGKAAKKVGGPRASKTGYIVEAVLGRMLMEDWGCELNPYPTRGHVAQIPQPVSFWRLQQ